MWMNASSTTVAANTLVSTPWAATNAAAKRASSSATTSTHASTALWVSAQRVYNLFCKPCLHLLVWQHRCTWSANHDYWRYSVETVPGSFIKEVCLCSWMLVSVNCIKLWKKDKRLMQQILQYSHTSLRLTAQWGVTGSSWLPSLSFYLQQQHAVGKRISVSRRTK